MALVVLLAIAFCMLRPATGVAGPLAPVDTTSPQATFESFIAAMADVSRVLGQPDDPGTTRVLESIDDAVDRAAQCLDLSRISTERNDDVIEVVPVQLQEILDRIELPSILDRSTRLHIEGVLMRRPALQEDQDRRPIRRP